MNGFLEQLEAVNGKVNGFVWGLPMLILLVGTGIIMTILTKCFQVSHFKHWIKNTIGGIFSDSKVTSHTAKEDMQISQFQSLCTALAATIGTGNIAGVAAAIASGGPGAIFWRKMNGAAVPCITLRTVLGQKKDVNRSEQSLRSYSVYSVLSPLSE